MILRARRKTQSRKYEALFGVAYTKYEALLIQTQKINDFCVYRLYHFSDTGEVRILISVLI